MEMKELLNFSEVELRDQYRKVSEEIFKYNNELEVSKKLEQSHKLREKKKERARVLTALNQKRVRS